MIALAKKKNELSVESGVLLWGMRVVVPLTLRKKVLNEVHVGHTGMVRMKAVARAYIYWPGMNGDIEEWVLACSPCMLNSNQPASAPPHPWEKSRNPWQRIHIDHAGPFMKCLFLVVVDTFSKWLEVRIVSSTSSKATISALRQMFASHGIPETIVSDNGSGFTSEEFRVFMEKNGIQHLTSAPYSPQSNGAAERAVQTVKKNLAKLVMERGEGDLETKLLRFLFAHRCTPQSEAGVSPAELLMRRKLRNRLTVIKETSKKTATEPNTSGTRWLSEGDLVLVRCFNPNRWVSGVIISHEGHVMYRVRIPEGIVRKHVNQMKSAPNLSNEMVGKEFDFSTEEVIEPEQAPVAETPIGAASPIDETDTVMASDEPPAVTQSAGEPSQPPTVPVMRASSRRNRGRTSRYDDYVQ